MRTDRGQKEEDTSTKQTAKKKQRRHIRHRDVRLTVEREPAILVGGYRRDDLLPDEEPLSELERLADTAGAGIVGKVVQNIREIRPDTYIGPGKVDQVADLAKRAGAKCILFDHDLTPAQGRNLDKRIGVKVMDRTDLILDIFASRARTRMARVQVSLALNEYRLPRLRRLWTHLERQTGGIGLRGGPGERQIETDRRKLLKNISDLKRERKEMEARKERIVSARSREHYLVSIVGYTNAGKSTLMRALTGEEVLIEDKLFATLDTKTSSLALGGGLKALLSDTVGFIRRLPHNLVASFHATLEEARSADLLLHVVDASSPHAREQIAAVDEVLEEIDAGEKETVLVFNKIDDVPPEQEIDLKMLCVEYPDAIPVSALKRKGLGKLRESVRKYAKASARPFKVAVHAGDGRTLAYMATHFFEDRRKVNGEWITIHGHATLPVMERLRTAGKTVKILSDGDGDRPQRGKSW